MDTSNRPHRENPSLGLRPREGFEALVAKMFKETASTIGSPLVAEETPEFSSRRQHSLGAYFGQQYSGTLTIQFNFETGEVLYDLYRSYKPDDDQSAPIPEEDRNEDFVAQLIRQALVTMKLEDSY